jgi:hypothetical protein
MIKLTIHTTFFFLIAFSISPNLFAQSFYTLRGTVIADSAKKPLKNAKVIVKENRRGAMTNDSGYFSITGRIPSFTIEVSAVGYIPSTRNVDILHGDSLLTVKLIKIPERALDEVVVTVTRERSKLKSVEMNVVTLNPEQIKRSPIVLGEPDILKALTLQPGITTSGEGAGGFSVRGGNADQNLVLVDGAPLFNTSHLMGFFTSVSPDAIDDITLYKGGMPSNYGGRLSSLLDMKVKRGNTDHLRFTSGITPVSARFYVDGPVINKKLTFIAGGRAAYPDLILNQLPNNFGESRAFFYDGIIKAEYSFNDKNKLSATGYRSYDRFRFDTVTRYDWTSNIVAFNFNSTISNKLSLRANANYSGFASAINDLPVNYQFKLRSTIDQKEAKIEFLYNASENNKTVAGVDYLMYDISPAERKPTSSSSNVNPLLIQKEHGRQMSAFVSDEFNFTDKITLQAGLRYTVYDYLGPKVVYGYETGVPRSKETITDSTNYNRNKSIQRYSGLEPRLALKIGVGDNAAIKLSYNRGQQFLHLISNTTAISPVDFWKLSDNYIKGQRGDQYSAGYFQSFANNGYDLSMEAYYRTVQNVVDYKDGATLLMNQYIETALLNSRARGYGVEVSISKNTGKLTGQFNYSYSKSETQILTAFPSEQINNGVYYPSNTDRPHNLAIVCKQNLGNGWSFNTNFIYSSGRPATYPDGNYVYDSSIVTNYSKRNFDRLPAYHRLDAGFSYVSKKYPEQKRYSVVNFSFYNLYLHKNAYSIFFQRGNSNLYAYRLSVVGTIIPSISWTYNF